MAQEGTGSRKVKGRSPNYPGINLEVALQRAQQLYDHERTNVAHFDTIIRHWGYQSASGSARVTFAALRKFGLLTDEGSGEKKRARLSELALRILQDTRENSSERIAAIREAALTPPIHRELWDAFGGSLPSPENMRFTLVRERGFTERGADDFIQEFRDTIAFAAVAPGATIPRDAETNQSPRSGMTTTLAPPDPLARSVQLPLGPGRWATLEAPFPFSEQDWTLMLAVLNAMKPGLVAEPPATPSREQPEQD